MPEDLASVPLTALAPTAFRAPVTEDLDKFYQRALRRLFYAALEVRNNKIASGRGDGGASMLMYGELRLLRSLAGGGRRQ